MTRTFILLLSIAIATGALMVTMGPVPASAYATVIRDCGDDYVITRYNQDGTVKGVWNKQLSDEGTIYTGGKTWKLVEGNPDRFVSDGGSQLQVVACDAAPGSGVRGLGGVQQDGAQAQSSTTLVSNVGQPHVPTPGYLPLSHDNAQSFTTGIQDTTLTRVDMEMRVTQNQQASLAVEIWSGDSVPSTKVGTLGARSSLFSSWTREEFAASGNGIDLAANTKYWVVINMSMSSSAAHVRGTTSTGEDPGAAAGWSIGNERRIRNNDSDPWDTVANHPRSLKINVVGFTRLPANFDCNAHLGWEQTNPRFVYTGQYANTREPVCELRFSSAGSGTYAEKLGYGYTLCRLAPTWQTPHPVTGEVVGGPDRKHYTGHKTLSGEDICSDFDGLRSTRDYLIEQHNKRHNP